MKRSIKLFLIVFVSMLFIQNVSAKTCNYVTVSGAYKAHGDTTYTYYDDQQYKNSFSSFDIPTTFDGKHVAKIKVTYTAWKANIFGACPNDKKKETKSYSVDMQNWGVEIYGAPAKGNEMTTSKECPEFLLVRVGVCTSSNDGGAYALDSKPQAESVLTASVKDKRWNNQSFYFIQKYVPTQEEIIEETTYKSCRDFKTKSGTPEMKNRDGCLTNSQYSCMWLEKNGVEYCNFDKNTYVKCGDSWDIPSNIPGIVSFFVTLLKIATPIILILVSIISLVKAVVSQKEDELKKAQSKLVKRLIAAAIVFFVVQITQFVIFKVADDDSDSMSSCFSCMLNNDCKSNEYYKTKEGVNYICTYFDGSNEVCH